MKRESKQRYAVIGTHAPRRCGIATFTSDLVEAIAATGNDVHAIVIDDEPGAYSYPPAVARTLRQESEADYEETAAWINGRNYDAICIQHEFGIYGGPNGSHITSLLRAVKCPVITTLHTILENPTPGQREVFEEIVALSDRLVVMSLKGADILDRVYQVEPTKVEIIPHGIPTVEFESASGAKAILGLQGRKLLLTFGLLSPDKGVEDVIEALPEIASKHPDVLYLVVGATHPHIRARQGETYRESLVDLAERLGMQQHVQFENRFVSLDDLTLRLQAADIYVTPYLKKEQITSGTLAYAFGCGNVVVSTPYWHAEELLADGRGILVPHSCPAAIAEETTSLLDDPSKLASMQKSAFLAGLEMQWPRIGQRYVDVFRSTRYESAQFLSYLAGSSNTPDVVAERGIPGLDHLLSISDDVGILQHSKFSIPLRSTGYCLDDVARSVLVLRRISANSDRAVEIDRAVMNGLSFIAHAFDYETGRFRNFMGYDRSWLAENPSEDAHGRALWTLGSLLSDRRMSRSVPFIHELIHAAAPVTSHMGPRGIALTLLGLSQCELSGYAQWSAFRRKLSEILHHKWKDTAEAQWPWFEKSLSYDNAHLAHALIQSAALDGDDQMLEDGLIALNWLMEVQTGPVGKFRPVGCRGFYSKDAHPAVFDQQPIETWTTVEALLTASRYDDARSWKDMARNVHAWFFGENDLGVSMIDPITGGCYDGLTPTGPNLNQGAESTISLVGSATRMILEGAEALDRTTAPQKSSISVA